MISFCLRNAPIFSTAESRDSLPPRLKEGLKLEKVLGPMREKRATITVADVIKVLKEGAEKARAQASANMKSVREKVGVAL